MTRRCSFSLYGARAVRRTPDEVKGDIHVARGEIEAARVAYLSAMTASGAEVLDRNYLQMKLNDLPSARPEGGAPAASEPPAAPAAAEPAPQRRRPRAGGGGRLRTSMLTRALLIAIAMQVVVACAGSGKDNAEPPAELTDIEQTLRVEKIWSSKVGGSAERLRLGLRPASDGARIYAGSHEGEAAAFDAQTGRKLWAVKTELPLAAGPGVGEGIVVFGTTDGDLVALDAESGMERWRQPVGSEVLAPPAIAPNVVLVRTVDGRLRGFSARDGATLWTVEQNLPALTLRGNTAPRLAGSMVMSGFNNGRVGAYEVGTGEVVWELAIANPTGRSELERLVDVSAGLQVVGTEVYVVGYQGRAVGIDLETGLVLWQQDMSSYAGLGADFNNIYVTNDVSASLRSIGAPARRSGAKKRCVCATSRRRRAMGTRIVVGDFEGYLHWLDANDGRFIARQRAARDRITAAPLVVGQNVFVQGDDGTVAAYTVRPRMRPAEPAMLPAIALVGRPNVGKSTLFNRLTRRATRSSRTIPGLTRDGATASASSPIGVHRHRYRRLCRLRRRDHRARRASRSSLRSMRRTPSCSSSTTRGGLDGRRPQRRRALRRDGEARRDRRQQEPKACSARSPKRSSMRLGFGEPQASPRCMAKASTISWSGVLAPFGRRAARQSAHDREAARRGDRPAERRQVDVDQSPARRRIA